MNSGFDDSWDELPAIFITDSSEKSLPKDDSNNCGISSKKLLEKGKRKTTPTADAKSCKKQKQTEEKKTKQAAAALYNVFKPGECMKHMYVEIHPELAKQWYMADVDRELCCVQSNLEVSANICDERLIIWSRRLDDQASALVNDECDTGLLVLTAKDIARLVHERTLSQHVAEVALISSRSITLVVFGTKDYFKSNRNKSATPTMSSLELEMAFTDLLISSKCDAVTVNTPNELALLIVQTTKAIAHAPHKKAKQASDEQADFFMRGDNKKCVAVDANGFGCKRVWQQMLAVLPQSSLEAARALTAHYPSPLALYQELIKEDGEMRVSEIGVTRAAVPEARARRIGPEFANKLHKLFTSYNGATLLD